MGGGRAAAQKMLSHAKKARFEKAGGGRPGENGKPREKRLETDGRAARRKRAGRAEKGHLEIRLFAGDQAKMVSHAKKARAKKVAGGRAARRK